MYCPSITAINWPGLNDIHAERLLGQKMVDEIDSLFPCLGKLLVTNFAIPIC
jgi:hypothetical protein